MSHRARIAIALLTALAVAVLSAGTAVAKTDRERYEAAVGKIVPPVDSFPAKLSRALCVCRSNGLVGAVESYDPGNGAVAITCTLYSFNVGGSVAGQAACTDWVPLTK